MQSSRRASWLRRSAPLGLLLVTAASPARGTPAGPDGPEPATSSPIEGSPDASLAERVIVVARMPGDDGVMTRLRAELRESDWLVVEVAFEDGAATPLATLAERERATAAVRVEPRRGVIELWVSRTEGAVEETLDASGERRSESVLALRVVEALRARGLRIERHADEAPRAAEPTVPPKAPSAAAVSPKAVEPPEPRAPTRLWLDLGPGLLVSPGGLGPELVLEAGLRLELRESLAFGLGARIPLAEQALSGPEGQADIATWTFGGTLELEWGTSSIGGFRSGIGASAASTTMSGDAESGFAGASDTVTTFAPELRTAFHVHMGPAFDLRAGVALGATIPQVEVAFGEREAATWGRPFVAASLALETNVASF
jgi:hypothetical protein